MRQQFPCDHKITRFSEKIISRLFTPNRNRSFGTKRVSCDFKTNRQHFLIPPNTEGRFRVEQPRRAEHDQAMERRRAVSAARALHHRSDVLPTAPKLFPPVQTVLPTQHNEVRSLKRRHKVAAERLLAQTN